ncbi:MAG: type II/IV secretion system protein [Verrucomicrobia bacterium]|nr:type II/IV secretion system protein [Verrucomicrobiota bacterium]
MVDPQTRELLDRLVEARQLSPLDRELLEKETEAGTAKVRSEEEVLRWLAAQYGLQFVSLDNVQPDKELLKQFPARVLLHEELLPLRRVDGEIEVAVARLFAAPGLDSLRAISPAPMRPVLATREAVQREIKKHLGVGADTLDSLEEEFALRVIEEENEEQTDLDKAAEDASIIRFVNQLLADAINLRATDIHIEPFEDELRIRYRIDGVLQEVPTPPQIKRFQPAIVSRIKILSHLNIAEKRLPQDGRIKIRVKKSEVDIRISIIPMIHGEAVVMRLLRQDAGLKGLEDLGMGEREERVFRQMLQLPHGIVLVTGPTGSGKTTTLYSALNEINDSARKIITIEDPVEYQLKGVNQIQVSEKAGLTFARGLRSILRHDPDVILIGEIRDLETAEIAVQSSLTGHLVFSTLHTNDAPSAVTRLVDMHVEPYLVASSLEAVLAQRLVRLLCPQCKLPEESPRIRALQAQEPALADATIYRPVGCRECRQTGYHGRHAIFEMMVVSPRIRELVLHGASSVEVKRVAKEEGMRTLVEDGWRLVSRGITTPDEVLRVSKREFLNGEA